MKARAIGYPADAEDTGENVEVQAIDYLADAIWFMYIMPSINYLIQINLLN